MKKLGFGCMRLPLTNPDDPTSVDLEQVKAMVDLFLERRFTYFDTAYFYHKGTSESVLKHALVNRHPRTSFTLADKLPLSSLKNGSIADQEEIFRCRLPKLTMQPILENSIIHGTELKIGTGLLTIHLERTQRRLLIRVSDNGIGMDAETLARLNSRLGRGGLSAVGEEREQRGGVALVNVDDRIRLLFGSEYGLHVFSIQGSGTDVEITLPAITSDREIPNQEALS